MKRKQAVGETSSQVYCQEAVHTKKPKKAMRYKHIKPRDQREHQEKITLPRRKLIHIDKKRAAQRDRKETHKIDSINHSNQSITQAISQPADNQT